jgi:post-segregation antitoxin (ccd killing protein)
MKVTVELDVDALAAARAAGVDLSELPNYALRRRLQHLNPAEHEQVARLWYEENKEAVDAYNTKPYPAGSRSSAPRRKCSMAGGAAA